jgi:hypothetical protein
MIQPLDAALAGIQLEIVGRAYEGAFYECRNGSIVGPLIDDGCEPSFGYAAALGGQRGENWLVEGWSRQGNRERDLVREIEPPLTWTGQEWLSAAPA